jgi:hypothetical protein
MILPRPAVKVREAAGRSHARTGNRPTPNSPAGVSRFARFCRRQSAYAATPAYRPDDFEPGAFIEDDNGVDAWWRYRGSPRLT